MPSSRADWWPETEPGEAPEVAMLDRNNQPFDPSSRLFLISAGLNVALLIVAALSWFAR